MSLLLLFSQGTPVVPSVADNSQWTWDSTEIDFSQTCWTFDGSNQCGGGAGEDYSEEEFIILAHYQALKLAIYAYYGIDELH